jgi:hypothetical protein
MRLNIYFLWRKNIGGFDIITDFKRNTDRSELFSDEPCMVQSQ